jgi:integrase/recombinase XerD
VLRVYTRHYPPCPQTNVSYRRCHCPKWINGLLPTGEFIRISARTRSWENGERKARLMELNADPLRQSPPDASLRITVKHAIDTFLQDEDARKLAKTTTCQSKTLFRQQLHSWCEEQRLPFLDQLTTAKLREFRASWKNSALTTQRKHHRLNGFFDFCIENDWLVKNPSKKMKGAKVTPIPTDYFTPPEFERIIDGTYAYCDWKGGHDFKDRPLRLRALILLLRWSGLSILDAVTLERQRLYDNRLLLYRHKTKVPVFVPLPQAVVLSLESLPNSNPRYFFWSGNGDPHTAKKCWQRTFRRLFKSVNLNTEDGQPKRCHPHMFRDTFAIELLLAGVPLDQVSILLGHSSIKITERHYSPFVKARQQQLEKSVQMAWPAHLQCQPVSRQLVS